jgi:membrane-bound lytic murein transglycosylase MltF
VFKKNAFSDTSLVMCREGIYRSKQLYDITKKNIAIEQFLYHQKDQILKRIVELQSTKFCFIHIDCDLSSSVEEIFKILQEGNLLADTCYVLFDDYGCATDLKQVADSILKTIKTKGWEVQEHSQTIFTKNFKLTRQN